MGFHGKKRSMSFWQGITLSGRIRALCWAGQFERIIRLTKQRLLKVIGKRKVTWKELKYVPLDIESTINNRLLAYVEDHIHTPILKPKLIIFGQINFGLEGDADITEDCGIKKNKVSVYAPVTIAYGQTSQRSAWGASGSNKIPGNWN